MTQKTVGIIGTIAFIITSIACYQGAMRGMPWLGMLFFTLELIMLLPLMLGARQRVVITLSVGAIGLLLDTILIVIGIYSVESGARWILPSPICPEWILALWLNFGLVMPNYLVLMQGKHIRAGLVGFLYAFMVYGGAARNDIIAMPNYGMAGVAIIAVAWAVLLPIMYTQVGKFYQKLSSKEVVEDAQGE